MGITVGVDIRCTKQASERDSAAIDDVCPPNRRRLLAFLKHLELNPATAKRPSWHKVIELLTNLQYKTKKLQSVLVFTPWLLPSFQNSADAHILSCTDKTRLRDGESCSYPLVSHSVIPNTPQRSPPSEINTSNRSVQLL